MTQGYLDPVCNGHVRPCGRCERCAALPRLRQAIIDNSKGDLFWIGEILLAELEKETGFRGDARMYS